LEHQLSRAGQVHSSMSAKLSALKGKLGLTEEEARSYVQVGPCTWRARASGCGCGCGCVEAGARCPSEPQGSHP
jgi:hypothetical protein